MQNCPGYGDEITWPNAPLTDNEDFIVTFDMHIGVSEVEVFVVAESNGYELKKILEVIYNGKDILPALDSCTHIGIKNHYERNADTINAAARKAAEDDAI